MTEKSQSVALQEKFFLRLDSRSAAYYFKGAGILRVMKNVRSKQKCSNSKLTSWPQNCWSFYPTVGFASLD